MICVFFGHKDTPESIKPKLEETIRQLIESGAVQEFIVGNQGAFDRMVHSVLEKLKIEYPNIQYSIALAYMPGKRYGYDAVDPMLTFLPEGIETVPRKFAISYRNKWMVDQADIVVSYVKRSWGGAAQFTEMAKRKGKCVINLAEDDGADQ